MSMFWPIDLDLHDTQSPAEILRKAQEEWRANSAGLVALVVQTAKSQSGNDMIIVHAKHVPSNRTAELFSVVHRPNAPYPAAIQPQEHNLPTSLKKEYYQSSLFGMKNIMESQGVTVKNPWVADTPSELRSLLEDAFNLGSVKSVILNLVSSYASDSDPNESEFSSAPDDADADRTESSG